MLWWEHSEQPSEQSMDVSHYFSITTRHAHIESFMQSLEASQDDILRQYLKEEG